MSFCKVEIVCGTYRLVQQDARYEVVEHLSDFRVFELVVTVAVNQLVFANRKVSQDFIIKVHVVVHSSN